MKVMNLTSILLMSILIAGLIACGGKEKTAGSAKQTHQMAASSEDLSHAMINLPTVQCGMCKEAIETGLGTVDGIVSINVDIEDKMGHVNYDTAKIDLVKIENAIAALGYQANKIMAVSEAYDKLPTCCKLLEDRIIIL